MDEVYFHPEHSQSGGDISLRRHYPDQVGGYDLSALLEAPRMMSQRYGLVCIFVGNGKFAWFKAGFVFWIGAVGYGDSGVGKYISLSVFWRGKADFRKSQLCE
jgi:hypothetical protein